MGREERAQKAWGRLSALRAREAQLSPETVETRPADLELARTATVGAATQPQTESWHGVPLSPETDGRQQQQEL